MPRHYVKQKRCGQSTVEINPQNGSSCASSEARRGHVDFALSLPLHSSFGTSALCNLRNARFRRSAKTGKRVQIPRCRATVSEDIALGHWEFPGKAADESGCEVFSC